MDWRGMVRSLLETLDKEGVGLASAGGGDPFEMLDGGAFVPEMETKRVFPPHDAHPRRIRGWLWDTRKSQVWRRPDAMVLIEQEGENLVGYVGRAGSEDDGDHTIVIEET